MKRPRRYTPHEDRVSAAIMMLNCMIGVREIKRKPTSDEIYTLEQLMEVRRVLQYEDEK